jgi:hypothetical protein
MRMLGVRQLRYNSQIWQITGRLNVHDIVDQIRRIREQDSSIVMRTTRDHHDEESSR